MPEIVGPITTASYNTTNSLATVVLKALSGEEASIGYGLLACALTMCRLLNPGKELKDEEEIEFVQAIMEWGGAYFPSKGKGN